MFGTILNREKILYLLLALFVNFSANAKEKSRPDSKGGDFLIELTTGLVLEEHEDVFELGIDFEHFISGTNHHFSNGLASEIEFKDHGSEYFFGPLISGYYHHFKLFLTTGVLTDFEGQNKWKNRIGFGLSLIHI